MGINTGFTTTTLEGIETVSYLSEGVMLVTCLGENATQLNEMYEQDSDRAVATICAELRVLHDMKPDDDRIIPLPRQQWLSFGPPQYAWARGSNQEESVAAAQWGVSDGIYVCNDGISRLPGWIEGALESASTLMRYFGEGSSVWAAVSAEGDSYAAETVLDTLKEIALQGTVALTNAVNHVERDSGGLTPLHLACGLNRPNAVRMLLDAGAVGQATDERRRTPLHIACEEGYENIVSLLLAHGVDPNYKDYQGRTPLELARQNSHKSVLEVMADRHVTAHFGLRLS